MHQQIMLIRAACAAGMAVGAFAVQTLHAQAKSPVYMIGLNEVTDADMLAILTTAACDRASEELVELALARGGRDNITAVVVRAEDPYASEKTLLNPAP